MGKVLFNTATLPLYIPIMFINQEKPFISYTLTYIKQRYIKTAVTMHVN